MGLGSWAHPSTVEQFLSAFPCSSVSHKIQMNQLFQGQSFNYLLACSLLTRMLILLQVGIKHKLAPSERRAQVPGYELGCCLLVYPRKEGSGSVRSLLLLWDRV